MARLPRYNLPGQPQHVIIRGNNRNRVFLNDTDYHFFLKILRNALKKYGCQLHAYVLMTNHIHMLITPLQKHALSKTIQSVGRLYVQKFNFIHKRTGTLWEGRYRATLIDSEEYALSCYRYIELNPVRAKMVKHPAAHPWSSFQKNALGADNPLITPHALYESLGPTPDKRQENYLSFFETKLAKSTIEEIREMTNKSWVLGSPEFKREIQKRLQRAVIPCTKGGDRKSKQFRLSREINRV